MFACLADVICDAIEVSKTTDSWSTFDLCRLPLRQATKRRRRLSPAFKINATQVAAKARRIRTVTQLMSAKDVFDKGSVAGEHKGTLEFAHTERFNYILSCLSLFDGCKSFGVNCDVSTMGGDDLLAVYMTNADRQIGAWGPPQVPGALVFMCRKARVLVARRCPGWSKPVAQARRRFRHIFGFPRFSAHPFAIFEILTFRHINAILVFRHIKFASRPVHLHPVFRPRVPG